ncbi:MAG TPA: hypothetical protein VGH54_23505 [Mycobacterium sp.]|uniref:hypothetical protein n=1 Tax=Mycobacterium sp. TaxID=1785 RepID=UPI002F40C0CB
MVDPVKPDALEIRLQVRITKDVSDRIDLLAAREQRNGSTMARMLLIEALTARESPAHTSRVVVPAEMVREAVRSSQSHMLPIHDGEVPAVPSAAQAQRAFPVTLPQVEPVRYSDEERAVADPAFRPGKPKSSKMPDPSNKVEYGKWLKAQKYR